MLIHLVQCCLCTEHWHTFDWKTTKTVHAPNQTHHACDKHNADCTATKNNAQIQRVHGAQQIFFIANITTQSLWIKYELPIEQHTCHSAWCQHFYLSRLLSLSGSMGARAFNTNRYNAFFASHLLHKLHLYWCIALISLRIVYNRNMAGMEASVEVCAQRCWCA